MPINAKGHLATALSRILRVVIQTHYKFTLDLLYCLDVLVGVGSSLGIRAIACYPSALNSGEDVKSTSDRCFFVNSALAGSALNEFLS